VTESHDKTPDEPTGSAQLAAQLEHEADIAADYIEVLLDLLDLAGDIDMDVEGSRATVSVVPDPEDATSLDVLVGEDGHVLDALQELTRLAVAQVTGERSRLMLDVAGYRQQRREQLAAQARDAVAQVRASGESLMLAPMTPFERKVVHDTVAAEGLTSESEGEEPHRRVVVLAG
jgi:spoIIIJ-associated protein